MVVNVGNIIPDKKVTWCKLDVAFQKDSKDIMDGVCKQWEKRRDNRKKHLCI